MPARALTAACVLLAAAAAAALPPPSPLSRFLLSARLARRDYTAVDECTFFSHAPKTITLYDGTLKKVGDSYNPTDCKAACLNQTAFRCAGALIQLPATCYVTGYALRDDYHSTHFERVCDKGTECFVRRAHSSGAGFTEVVEVPWYFVQSWSGARELRELFCLALCEREPRCVAVDLRHDQAGKRARCAFLDLGEVPDQTHDLYLRRC